METVFKVRFLPLDITFPADESQSILDVAMRAGVHVNASCSGNGVCGKCRVRVLEGTVKSTEHPKVSAEDYEGGTRLACQTMPASDLVVEIPLESQIDKNVLKKTSINSRVSDDYRQEGAFGELKVRPLVRKGYAEMSPPNMADNVSDWSRLLRVFREKGARDNPITTSLEVLRGVGRVVRDGQWKVTASYVVNGKNVEVVALEAGDTTETAFAVAIDIGTTTVCGRLVAIKGSRCSGHPASHVVAESADYNGQISYGEDVISRIMFSRKKGGLRKLQGIVTATINGVLRDLLSQSGIDPRSISQIIVAGNTVMTHLFLGIDPTYIMLAPYTPTAVTFPACSARSLGIELPETARAYLLPCVASYIGGDIVSGVLASAMTRHEELSLFMDIGTNGEIVLGNKEWLLSVSCSAGPAFEGGGIQFGVRATSGAIEQVKIHPATFEPMILTIGKAKPLGICGSGLIDLAAGLLEAGLIDQKGRFIRDAATRRVREGDGCWEYLVCEAEDTSIDKDIVITEIDLDNLIRTKAAIFAGCKVLLDSAGLTFNDVRYFIIAGGFGHYIDLQKAKTIGLLPELSDDTFRFIGNSSLTGAHLISLDGKLLDEAQKIAGMMTNVELSNNPGFMEEFTAAMFLPHTNDSFFPSVRERLRSV